MKQIKYNEDYEDMTGIEDGRPIPNTAGPLEFSNKQFLPEQWEKVIYIASTVNVNLAAAEKEGNFKINLEDMRKVIGAIATECMSAAKTDGEPQKKAELYGVMTTMHEIAISNEIYGTGLLRSKVLKAKVSLEKRLGINIRQRNQRES